jgi:beta-glucosidase/6-phospho-beta-glucosidase/beta-galactosidase
MEDDFRFGVATADHQCEAYNGHDDIRDVWARVRGVVPRGRATDFWNRYREDADLAKGLGCRIFRISLSWARLEPDAGSWSDEAFTHYRELLQYLRDAGMQTLVTLHHNTWPVHVQAAGQGAGMLDDGFPARFGEYGDQVARRLGDLIDYYVTINEPNQLLYGFVKAFWMPAYSMPPGLGRYATSEEQMDAVQQLVPNLFRAHAFARDAIRAIHPNAMVGSNPNIFGLPGWLKALADRSATHVKSPGAMRKRAGLLSQWRVLDRGLVDISIAQISVTDDRKLQVLFSEPYETATNGTPMAVAVPLGSRTLLDAVNNAIRLYKHIAAGAAKSEADDVPDLDWSVDAIRKRGVLRVGVRPGASGLCTVDASGAYHGIEPDIAHLIAEQVFADPAKVEFVVLQGEQRVRATRTKFAWLDWFRKSIALFGTLLGTNWWNLGMAGKLPEFLCPATCVGTLDYVGLDYYWGVSSFAPRQLHRLIAAMSTDYGDAPVWPGGLGAILRDAHAMFPDKPIIVVENGSVTNADGVARADYFTEHVREVTDAKKAGLPIVAYLAWSITSNREWGLPFNDNSDFGLYHIDLDTDPDLKRVPTASAQRYAEIIASHKGTTA